MKVQTNSLDEFNAEAGRFATSLTPRSEGATVIALSGQLGAGKTAFVQVVAKTFGVTEIVSSPTFVIEKIYQLQGKDFKRLIHIDAYRLTSSEELLSLGWKEIVADSTNLIFLEWPEHVESIIPHLATCLTLTGSDNERTIQYL